MFRGENRLILPKIGLKTRVFKATQHKKKGDKMNRYLQEFLSLKCSGDVLNVVNPLGNKSAKEITESMSMLSRVKRIALKKPMHYNVVDMCAGNALTSILSVFVLPVNKATAIDKRERGRKWNLAKRFSYVVRDIKDIEPSSFTEEDIIISVHPCGELAKRVIKIWKESESKHLLLMPCCSGNFKKNTFLREKLGVYTLWCLHLASLCGGDLIEDKNCLSPKNIIISANK